MRKINYYNYPHPNNVGDTLTPYILMHFIKDAEFKFVREQISPKLIAVGSIMRVIKPGDTILGSGVMRATDTFPQASQCKFLAVRGKLSREILQRDGGQVPAVYGDPAILLPLMYSPVVKKKYKIGLIPHFVDKRELTPEVIKKLTGGASYKIIDVFLSWREFVDEILECEHVIASSLHGIIIAEAYGLTAEWVVLSDRVIGSGFKFKDYLTGTERDVQDPGKFPALDPRVLLKMQKGLLKALTNI